MEQRWIIGDVWGDGGHPKIMDAMITDGWLVPDDTLQAIADTWPMGVDDSAARQEWGWEPDWDLDAMTADMLEKLRVKLL